MAKQLVNPIERHAEKAVLALTGLALVAVIALYVVTSPNQIELGPEKVSPSTIDGKVAQKAADVVGRLRAAEPKTPKYEPLYDIFTGSLEPLGRNPLPMAVAIGPDVPIVDPKGTPTGQADLVKVNRPAKPTVSNDRGTIVIAGAGGQPRYVPIDWVTVSALFDVKAQSELQRSEYGATRDEVVFAPPEIQRRILLPNGSWSDGDWVDVKPWPSVSIPPPPVITFFDEKGTGTAVVDKDQLKKIDEYYSKLQHSKMQLDILRPMPPTMAPPTRWTLPVITSYRDVMIQDDEYLYESPSPDPVDRYGVSGEAPKRKEAVETKPTDKHAALLQEGQKFLERAQQNNSENDATEAINRAVEVITDRNPPSSSDKAKAEKLHTDATQVKNDIKRRIATGGGVVHAPTQPTGIKKPREKLPKQQVWAHDAAENSIRNGETYQYRMRFRIYNRLAGAPDRFKKPELAKTVFIAGEWSEPSDPVVIEPASKFFITSDDQKDEEVGVEFYQWFGGVWVKAPRRIKATVGGTIRDVQRTQAPAFDNPDVVDNPEVPYVADGTIVDIDFDRAFRERKAGNTPKGVKFGVPSPSASVVFLDSQGRLHERLVSIDKVHPEKREMTGRLWVPPKPK